MTVDHDPGMRPVEPKTDKEILVQKNTEIICIDDRLAKRIEDPALAGVVLTPEVAEKASGLLGGSLISGPMLAETAPVDQEMNMDEFVNLMFDAHDLAGLKVGVHMDDHHGEMSEAEITDALKRLVAGDLTVSLKGCGFYGMVNNAANPLGFSERTVAFFQQNPNLLERMVAKGARVSVLEGHHADKDAGQAWAVRVKTPGMTVSRQKLTDQGEVAPYVHNDETFDALMEATAVVLERQGKTEWAANLRAKNQELNDKWLNIASNALAGKTPEVME